MFLLPYRMVVQPFLRVQTRSFFLSSVPPPPGVFCLNRVHAGGVIQFRSSQNKTPSGGIAPQLHAFITSLIVPQAVFDMPDCASRIPLVCPEVFDVPFKL